MALNIKKLEALPHPEVTYPVLPLTTNKSFDDRLDLVEHSEEKVFEAIDKWKKTSEKNRMKKLDVI